MCTRRIRTREPMISSPTLTTRLLTAAAESTENLWYLCTVLINVYVAGPNPNSAILCLRVQRGERR